MRFFQNCLGGAILLTLILNVTYVVGLSQFGWAVSKLAVLGKWAISTLEEMFAHLGLVLLLQGVELALVSVEIVEVALLG